MPLLPANFEASGVLPIGDYLATVTDLQRSLLIRGPAARRSPTWDAPWRLALLGNFSLVLHQLAGVGITEVYIDGSFAEDKDHPSDIDGYFECDAKVFASGHIQRELNRLDPHKCWTWDAAARRPSPGSMKRQLPMWHAYRVELYPHFPGLIAGLDQFGNALEFPAFFRQRRADSTPKGIVKVTGF